MSWDLCHVEREISETHKKEKTEIHNMFQGLAEEGSEEDRDSEDGGDDLYLSAEEEEVEEENFWEAKKSRVGKSLKELRREKSSRWE
eukprot:12311718-Karenia_brevis.AAC.1